MGEVGGKKKRRGEKKEGGNPSLSEDSQRKAIYSCLCSEKPTQIRVFLRVFGGVVVFCAVCR